MSGERSRTITWDDPLVTAAVARRMPGIEFLRAIQQGDLPPPPIARLMGFSLVDVQRGLAVFALTPDEALYNPIGTVHGGVAATLCDSAMGCAVHSTLDAGVGYTTLEIKVNLVRALGAGTGSVRCEGRTIYVGGRTATAEARIADGAGTLYAHATSTCLIFRG